MSYSVPKRKSAVSLCSGRKNATATCSIADEH
jgi:hypothetical protein